MTVEQRTIALGHQLLNLMRHDNISGVVATARQIQTEASELGISLEDEGGSLYLCFGDERIQIRREGPQQGVRYVGEFGSEFGSSKGRPQRVPIEIDAITRLAAYLQTVTDQHQA
jgi:hypothetical protein